MEGNGPATKVTRGPVSQYLSWFPESSPAQATGEQPVAVLVDAVSHMSVVRADLVVKTKLKEEIAKLENDK